MRTDKEIIEMLAESNMELSYLLAGGEYNKSNHPSKISHLFGYPLNEIYDILMEHEDRKKQNENRNIEKG